MAILRDVTTVKDLMITEKNTSPRKAFRSAPKTVEQDASLENASCSDSKEEQAVLSGVKRCHHLLHIPMLRTFDSLNVAQAGGILTSCFARQHLEKNPSGE